MYLRIPILGAAHYQTVNDFLDLSKMAWRKCRGQYLLAGRSRAPIEVMVGRGTYIEWQGTGVAQVCWQISYAELGTFTENFNND